LSWLLGFVGSDQDLEAVESLGVFTSHARTPTIL